MQHRPRLPRSRGLVVLPATFLLASGCGEVEIGSDLVAQVIEVSDVGFQGPRAVVHDPVADLYLVANMNGDPFAEAENGFVSRVAPDGEVQDLTWLQTTGPQGVLHAPRGMAIRGDSVLVADIRCVRVFQRETGQAESATCMEAVSLLSGIDVGPEGSLFVTDSGLRREGDASGTAGVFRLIPDQAGRGATLASGPELGHAMGVAVGTRGIFVATTDPGQILRLTAAGERTTVIARPAARFEGVVFVGSGFAFTSSSDEAVYLVDGEGRIHTLLEGVGTPGDLGFDTTRNRLLVPLEERNSVLIVELAL